VLPAFRFRQPARPESSEFAALVVNAESWADGVRAKRGLLSAVGSTLRWMTMIDPSR
jgi:hypothetical protein